MKTYLQNFAILSISFILFFTSCIPWGPSPQPATPSGNWVQRFNISGLPRNGASSWVIGDTGYIIGGYNSKGDSCLSDLWQFDPVKNTWLQKAFFPGTARQSGVGFVIGTNGYYATGTNSKINQIFQDCWQYNSSTNTWTKMSDLPNNGFTGSGARYDAVAFTIGNYGYVGTGYDGNNYLNDFWKFDPVANSWTVIPNSPLNKRSGAVAFTNYNDTTAYIVTGINNGTELNDFWSYNPTSGWHKLRDIANTNAYTYDDSYTDIIRDHAVAIVQPNGGVWKAYIATGQYGSLASKIWEYDFKNDIWNRKTSYERSTRFGAVSWSFINLKRGFVGTGKTAISSVSDYDEWFPAENYNPND